MILNNIVRTQFDLVLEVVKVCNIMQMQDLAVRVNDKSYTDMTYQAKPEELNCSKRKLMIEWCSDAIVLDQKAFIYHVQNKKVPASNRVEKRHSWWVRQDCPECSQLLSVNEESTDFNSCIQSFKVILDDLFGSTTIWFVS